MALYDAHMQSVVERSFTEDPNSAHKNYFILPSSDYLNFWESGTLVDKTWSVCHRASSSPSSPLPDHDTSSSDEEPLDPSIPQHEGNDEPQPLFVKETANYKHKLFFTQYSTSPEEKILSAAYLMSLMQGQNYM